MTIHQRRNGDVLELIADGDLTMGARGATRLADMIRSLLQQGHHHIVLDMGRVRYVDSAGLGELIQCSAAARTRGGTLKLLNVGQRLSDLLVVTRLVNALECYPPI
jgi:anti-sigma B factor antagonist